MKVVLQTENGCEDMDEAIAYAREHVVIRRADVQRIGELAKRLGFYAELQALEVQTKKIVVHESCPRARTRRVRSRRIH